MDIRISRSRKTEPRSRKTELRSIKSEPRSRKTEPRSRKTEPRSEPWFNSLFTLPPIGEHIIMF